MGQPPPPESPRKGHLRPVDGLTPEELHEVTPDKEQGGRQDPVGHSVRTVDLLKMRLAGMTYEQIAERTGYADGSGVRQFLLTRIGRHEIELIEEWRALENQRLDAAQVPVWAIMMDPNRDPNARLKATDVFLRI